MKASYPRKQFQGNSTQVRITLRTEATGDIALVYSKRMEQSAQLSWYTHRWSFGHTMGGGFLWCEWPTILWNHRFPVCWLHVCTPSLWYADSSNLCLAGFCGSGHTSCTLNRGVDSNLHQILGSGLCYFGSSHPPPANNIFWCKKK